MYREREEKIVAQFNLTVVQLAVINTVAYGVLFGGFIIWLSYRHHGWRTSYMPFMDLLSYGLTGIGIIVGISAALQTFSSEYEADLQRTGMSNVVEPYRAIYDEIRQLRDDRCSADRDGLDCSELQSFLRSAYIVVEDSSILVPVETPARSGVSRQAQALMQEYNRQHEISPRPMEVASEVFKHITWVAIPLWLGFLIGLHRRWILYWRSLKRQPGATPTKPPDPKPLGGTGK